ncbi:Bicupin, oxalate decarboxylase/oxidase [Pleomassaria siparia CBS 279.74]|uniref:Bicupin, oxalate decarboxylase/oxidase n=1 Tax=Pleomassaria siparia CBS 279.74 TaxID=1314801 RepID=A0A6G1JR78_9PLEO|nr:Bicupin, oxalate decarboxylase/oxidase [Pleomassaria siparia CBS 279.74]
MVDVERSSGQVMNLGGREGSSGSLRGSESLLGYDTSNDIPMTTPSTVIPPSDFELAPNQDADDKLGLYIDLSNVKNPQPIQGSTTGPTDPGPRTQAYDRLNSDIFIPPTTDFGDVPNAKWPFGLSANRHGLAGAGWARQQNTDQIPTATAMAGVNMRLSPNAYRELHWHKDGEWALMLNGSVRIQAVNEDGQTFVDDLTQGDVWFFPQGVPHSIQAFEDGCEFLLVFNSGDFSEDNTFLLSELMERTPKSVVAKNFRTSVQTFDKLPDGQLWIFPGTAAPSDIADQTVVGDAGQLPQSQAYSYHFSKQEPYTVPGGSIKIIDPSTFPIADTFSAALITVEPGAMREMHWHTVSDEWTYFLQGNARLTVYSAPASSRTFDFSAGDVGYVPVPNAHYLENTGTETLMFLEVLQASKYSDISVNQWLGLTAKQVVKDHLNVDDAFLATLPKVKTYVVPGNKNLSTTNFTGTPL